MQFQYEPILSAVSLLWRKNWRAIYVRTSQSHKRNELRELSWRLSKEARQKSKKNVHTQTCHASRSSNDPKSFILVVCHIILVNINLWGFTVSQAVHHHQRNWNRSCVLLGRGFIWKLSFYKYKNHMYIYHSYNISSCYSLHFDENYWKRYEVAPWPGRQVCKSESELVRAYLI